METLSGPGSPGLSDRERERLHGALGGGQEMPAPRVQAPAERAEVGFKRGEAVEKDGEEWFVADIHSDGRLVIARRLPNGEQQHQPVWPEQIQAVSSDQPTPHNHSEPAAQTRAPGDSLPALDALQGLEPRPRADTSGEN